MEYVDEATANSMNKEANQFGKQIGELIKKSERENQCKQKAVTAAIPITRIP